MARSQVSFDFLAIWSVVLILFLALMGVYVDKSGALADESVRLSALGIARGFARSADAVYLAGPGGFESVWLLPSLPDGQNYSIRVLGSRVEVNWTRGSVSEPLIFSNFNGTATAVLSSGNSTNLTNIGGVVYFVQW